MAVIDGIEADELPRRRSDIRRADRELRFERVQVERREAKFDRDRPDVQPEKRPAATIAESPLM